MALLERCKDLRERIERHEALRRAATDAEGFRQRAEALELSYRLLTAELGRVRVLREKGIALSKMPDPASPRAALHDYEAAVSQEATDSGREYSRLKRSVDKVARDLATVVEKAVESIKKDLPSIEEAFLRQVELIPDYAERVRQIRRERDALEAGSASVQMSPEELASFLERRDQLRELANRLDPAEFPREVLAFFRAARQAGGAPLEKLTDGVRAWLEERNLLKELRVTIATR